MARRIKPDTTKAVIDDMGVDKKQKREWQPRGDKIPISKIHIPRRAPYDRTLAKAQNWRDYIHHAEREKVEDTPE